MKNGQSRFDGSQVRLHTKSGVRDCKTLRDAMAIVSLYISRHPVLALGNLILDEAAEQIVQLVTHD